MTIGEKKIPLSMSAASSSGFKTPLSGVGTAYPRKIKLRLPKTISPPRSMDIAALLVNVVSRSTNPGAESTFGHRHGNYENHQSKAT
jgi:hypothetical protein